MIWSKSQTVEFRIHPPTLNATRAINWLFITSAIVKYARRMSEVHYESFLRLYMKNETISLDTMIDEAYKSDPKLCQYLKSYIAYMKDKRKHYDANGDFIGKMWCLEDNGFTFEDTYIKSLA